MLTRTDDPVMHIHLYVENSLEPESLRKVLTGVHKLKGVPLDRGIQFSATVGAGMIINTQPVDAKTLRYLANYEVFWLYNPDVLLAPAKYRPDIDTAKFPIMKDLQKDNLVGWSKKDVEDFNKQFDFKYVGPHEEEEIRRFFKSDHFKKWLRLFDDPDVSHAHCNVEINFDPGILMILAREALEELGLKVDWAVPMIWGSPPRWGKVIFMFAYPEQQHDIAWEYHPDAVIRPATKPFYGLNIAPDGDFRFDLNIRRDWEAALAAGKHVPLTDEEINKILTKV
jgi:hypothetical protein